MPKAKLVPIKKATAAVITKFPQTNQHHIRLTPELQRWAKEQATSYRSVAAFIVDVVRNAYHREQSEQSQRKAA